MKKNKNKGIEVTLLQEGILHIHLKEHTEITLNDAALALEKWVKLVKEKNYQYLLMRVGFVRLIVKLEYFLQAKKIIYIL